MTISPDAAPVPHRARRLSRISRPYPVRVRGRAADGQGFKLEALVENISAGGLYVALPLRVEPGARLSVVIRFATDASAEQHEPPRVAARGVVLRAEPQRDGRCGLAIAFTHHRFL